MLEVKQMAIKINYLNMDNINVPDEELNRFKDVADAMTKEAFETMDFSKTIDFSKFGNKSENAFYAYLGVTHGGLIQKKACKKANITPQHYRSLKKKHEEEWKILADMYYSISLDARLDLITGLYLMNERTLKNLIIALGIAEPAHTKDFMNKTEDEKQQILSTISKNINAFLDAGKKAGYEWEIQMEPHEVIEFYTKLTPEERVSFGCKP
jgi:hypothetical protein